MHKPGASAELATILKLVEKLADALALVADRTERPV